MTHSLRIASVAVRELVQERVFYILLLFAASAVFLSLLLGQLTYAEQSKLTLDFLLAATQISMVMFAVFMGIGLFKRELTMGSVSMVLSKPVSRTSFLIGKFLGQTFIQAVVIALMSVITMALCLQYAQTVSFTAIAQVGYMIFLEVTILTAVAYFASVNTGPIVASLLSIGVFLIGHFHGTFRAVSKYSGESPALFIGRTLFPNLEVFNIKAMASYGNVVSAPVVFWATGYGLLCTLFFIVLAIITFKNKDIFT